jgi:hypothetical protein
MNLSETTENFKVGDALLILAEYLRHGSVKIQPNEYNEKGDIVLTISCTPGSVFVIEHQKTLAVMSHSDFGKMAKFYMVTSSLGFLKDPQNPNMELSASNIRYVFKNPSDGLTIAFGGGIKIPVKGHTERTFRTALKKYGLGSRRTEKM